MRNQFILTPLAAAGMAYLALLGMGVAGRAASQPLTMPASSAQQQMLTPTPASAQTSAPAPPPIETPSNMPASAADNDVILAMHAAFLRNDQAQLTTLLPLAHGHPLEPWAAYWELKVRLESATPVEVQAFFTRWAGTYQEDRLRNDWLLILGKNRDWSNFAAEYPNFRMRDDPQVACYAIAMTALQGGTVSADAAAQVRKNWFAQRELDDGCLLAAGVLHQTGQITDTDLWRRARVALQAGHPDLARAAAQLAAPQADMDVAQIQNSAVRYLYGRSLAQWPPAVRQQLAALALIKIAAQDPDQAASLMARWASALPQEARNWVWGAIGEEAALHLSDTALGYYAHAKQPADLNDNMLAWQARAALRQGQWHTVLTAIDALHGPAREKPEWIYWSARARMALAHSPADKLTARRDLMRIAGMGGFYPKLALEDLGGLTIAPPPPAPLTAEEKNAARNHPGLARALLMISLGMRPEGVREWNYWTNLATPGGMSDRELYAAADLACQNQVWDRCINASERTRSFMDYSQRFPMPYRRAVLAASYDAGIDPAAVYGLIRQESRFITVARSGVGASGLMQLMPATARLTAQRLGLAYNPGQLQDQATNLLLGTSYLKQLLDGFDSSLPLATAAYNAGPRRPRAWRLGPTLEGAIWIENIPFSETRGYVKKVLANTTDYAAILTGQPQSLKNRLGQIGPPPVDADIPSPGLP
ncbi:MAG: transglycosylase SLT domain-containing protein [Burkholderiaceae bacterium]|jgi:soluble lytic murein transglycosylase|nr:transglycosylase SLT domain-containing protein [Burkholderiaceae bacterium]